MKDNQQFEQLILQYTHLNNGSEEIRRMIEKEDFDSAMTMLKTREALFLNCKCIRKFLELTSEQETVLNNLLDELRASELDNIKRLESAMQEVKQELRRTQQAEKIQQAYDFAEGNQGSIVNYSD